MPITITSTTDTPEDVASAMGAEIEEEEQVEGSTTTEETTETTEEEVKTEPTVKTETDDEQETEEEEEVAQDPAKPKKITGYKKKAMRLEEENRLLLDLLKKQSEPEEEVVEEVADGKTKTFSGKPQPTLADFKDQPDPHAAFTKAITEWALEEADAKAEAKQAERDAASRQNADITAFNSRLSEIRGEGKIYSDYDTVLESIKEEDLPTPPLMQALIMTARDKTGKSISADIMYYLASHPEEHREIAALPDAQLAVEMGVVKAMALAETTRRTAEIAKKSKPKSETKSKTETVANSDGSQVAVTVKSETKPKLKTPPPPIKPVGKRTAPASTDVAAIAESGDFKAYEARRRAQGFKYR